MTTVKFKHLILASALLGSVAVANDFTPNA